MDSVNKTLYIPLYGKSLVSRRGILLHDPRAEEIWNAEGFPLKGKSASKWLAFYMGIRASVFDRWVSERIAQNPDAVVVHLGCGLDSRVERVNRKTRGWFDVDFPQVIQERKRYYQETDQYKMVASDIRRKDWLAVLPRGNAIIVMEGVSMYLRPEELEELLAELGKHFDGAELLMDCYTTFAAKVSRYKNPIRDVGVSLVYGLDDPAALAWRSGARFLREHDMTPQGLTRELHGLERWIFQWIYGGAMSRRLYRLYEFRLGEN